MIHIYTDGSCWPNPSASGGWGFVAYLGDAEIHTACGPCDGMTTNNRMEIAAVIKALEWAGNQPARIFSDSQYVVNGLNAWCKGWARNDWIRKAKRGTSASPVPNAELWRYAMAVRQQHHELVWVRGHAGTLGNERADALAEAGRQLCTN